MYSQEYTGMYDPNQQAYGAYGDYWAASYATQTAGYTGTTPGYTQPPAPPPPLPSVPPPTQTFQIPPPTNYSTNGNATTNANTNTYQQVRNLPPTFRTPPPPPPPPDRSNSLTQNQNTSTAGKASVDNYRSNNPHQQQQPPFQSSSSSSSSSSLTSSNYKSSSNFSSSSNYGSSTNYGPSSNYGSSNFRSSNYGSSSSSYNSSSYSVTNEDNDSYNNKNTEPTVGTPLTPRSNSQTMMFGGPNRKRPADKAFKQPYSANRPLPVELDPDLPKELVSKLAANECQLCSVKLNSRIQSVNHYEGKPHKKKVKQFLLDLSRKDADTDAKILKLDTSKVNENVESIDVSQLKCKICDTSFSTEQYATQHFNGKNHQKVVNGIRATKAGYYNKETGSYQSSPLDKGAIHEKADSAEKSSDAEDTETTESPDKEGDGKTKKKMRKKKPVDSDKDKERYFCEMCNVSCTSKDQLEGHMAGQRHAKSIKAQAKKATATTPGEKEKDNATASDNANTNGKMNSSEIV